MNSNHIVNAVVWIICLGLVFWLLWWLIGYLAPPEPFRKVANAILAVAAVVLLINVIMSIGGHPIWNW